MAGTQGIGVFGINSKFASGSLVFYEKAVGRTVTGDVFTVGTAAVKVGGTSQDVDFQYYGTGSLSAIIDTGAATLTLVGLTSSTDKPLTISDATESTSTTTGALIVSGGIGFAKDMYVGDDVFLTSAAKLDWNAGDVTLTHAANLLTIAGGGLTIGADAAGFDFKAFGGTAGNSLLYDASEDQLVITQTNAATTGVERTLDVSQTHTGIGASAEALRSTITTNVAGGTYMNALFGKIDFQTVGKVTGLAGVVCGELTMAGGAVSQGTYCVFEAEINLPTSYSSSVPIEVMRIEQWGAQKADFDTYGYLFEIVGCASGSGKFWYDATNGTTDEWIRVKTPSGDRYIMLSDVQTEA